MKKRVSRSVLSLILTLCLTLSMLPSPALAAVGDLVDNDPAENESILSQLEDFSGQSYEEAYTLLDSLGLLDEDGNLATDQSIVLDGEEYTLEEIEAQLNDPTTDLTKVAEVDEMPIALGDLKTIIAIERELQYLQEKYFTGATFQGEARNNLNSLMTQLQTEGITLSASNSAENQIVFDTSEVKRQDYTLSDGLTCPIYYIEAGEVFIPGWTTLTVKFKLNFSEALNPEISELFFITSPVVYISDTITSSTNNDLWLTSTSNSALINIENGTSREYILSIQAKSKDYRGPLYLCMRGPTLQNPGTLNYDVNFAEFSFGDLWQAVSFYDADGFFFQDGENSPLRDQWNGYFSVSNPQPDMPDFAEPEGKTTTMPTNKYSTHEYIWLQLASMGLTELENTLTYLQRCIDEMGSDKAIRTHVSATIEQTNRANVDYSTSVPEVNRTLIVPEDVFRGPNAYIVGIDDNVSEFPLNIPSGTSKTIAYDIISTTPSPTYTLNFGLYLYFCKNQDVTWDQVRSDREWEYIDSVNGYTVTSSNLSYSLVNDATKPSLTVSALEGNYRSGDVIPITITGNEFIKVDNLDNAKIKINDAEYSLSDLHASSSGKYITLFYEVKEIDAGTLTVGIPEGTITDYWGNGNTEVNNETVDGVNITTPVLKNAVTGLSASYNVSTGEVEFSIAVSQVEQYRNLYNLYTNTNPAFQLLVTVEDGEAQTVAVTMGEDSNKNIVFTAEPLAVRRAAEDQPITVQIQANDGSGEWETVRRLTTNTTVPARVPVTDVEIDVAEKPEGYNYRIALSDTVIPKLEVTAIKPDDATYVTGSWHSNNEEVATIDATGQIKLTSGKVGEVIFTFSADNGTADMSDDTKSNYLVFKVTAGGELALVFPTYAQDSLVREGKDATVKWNTNALVYYPGKDITFTVNLYKGQDTSSDPVYTGTVENETELTIPAEYLKADYPQSQYTVQVSMTEPESRTATASITVLSPPTVMRVTADNTSITEQDTLTLDCTISNNSATGTLAATRMTEKGKTSEDANDCLRDRSVSGGKGTIIFDPKPVEEGSLYDTYTITFTENGAPSDNFTPSTDSIVITVYRSGALEIEGEETINLSNVSKVDGMTAGNTSDMASEKILALRQELGLLEFIRVNADDYNWSSISDGIQWASSNPDAVNVNYRQGGLWDNIEDLPYETYLPESQMSVSATADVEDVTVTATHAATGMSDSVTVNVDTLRHQFYLFQATPAEKTQVAYTNGDGERVTTYTNKDGLLALYEPSGIDSNVVFSSGEEKNPNLGTILKENLASGEKDAAKLQLYPLNTITLQPAAKAEVYLVEPDGSPYVGNVTLRGGVYLAGIYSDNALLGNTPGSLQNGGEDATYTTDPNGKLTVYMDATQFRPDGYGGQLTNADLDYWFELSDIDNNTYYPTLVNIQGTMSPDYKLRTGSAVVTLTEVPDGEAEQPFLIAQTLSYAKENADEGLQVRSVLGSTGKVGPNSTYKYTELTSRIMLWGVDNDLGESNVLMTGEDGFAPEAQTVDVNTFPFASIPIITNTLVLTEDTMTNSGWLEAETPESLSASIYQNDVLMKTVTMPFQVVDLTNVKLVDDDAQALVVEMTGSFTESVGNNQFSLGTDNKVSDAFGEDIRGMLNTLNTLQETGNPLFRVLITPSEDSSVFNVLIWGGYNSLDIDDFDYSTSGFTTGSSLMEAELNVGVPPLNDLSDMAKGTYDSIGSINEAKYNRTNSGLDIGAQLEGYYEGQFYYDLDQGKWAFRTVSGGMTAGASLSFQANINAWVGPVPITATFAAGIAMQLDFKAATVYKDQVSDTSGWKEEHLKADSVNDYLTTLRIQGYIDAFGGLGFDYCVLALKIGLYGRLTGDTTNTFLSRTYLANEDDSQISGHAVGVNGEVGIKFFAKFLFVSYETVIASGHFNATSPDENYQYINDYWNGSGASGTSLTSMGAPTLLSRAYLAAYAGSASQRWSNPASFGSQATEVQSDANPGSEPAVNDDGSLSVYISDMGVKDYFASRIMAGSVGTEGEVIDNNGYGDMSPSISGNSDFTVAAWIRLFENLDKNAGEKITSAEEKQLLNSTEIMVATTADNGGTWEIKQLTDNVSPDLAPATAANGGNAIVFWRNAYTSSDDPFAEAADEDEKFRFDTQDNIWFSQYKDGTWDDAKMVYNGSLGSVVGMQAAMLPDGNAILAFTIDRTDNIKATGYEMAYRTVASDGTLGDLVVLTNDSEIDTNPQVTAVSKDGKHYFVLGWYSSRSDGDIRLQAVNGAGQLYTGHNQYAVPESTSAIIGESNLAVSSDFRFAKGVSQDVNGLTLVWAETVDVVAEDGTATPDHSVLYGAQLCAIGETMYLSSPQALITLPNRTLSNSFSAWKDSGTVNAYIFGTWYDPENPDSKYLAQGLSVPSDTDKLLTGGGSMVPNAVTVDQIVVDYQNLQTLSFTPVVFTLRNTGTTKLTNLTVDVGAYAGSPVTLYPGESATVTVMYKTDDSITNPTYTIGADAGNPLVTDTLYLNYNDIGISSMDVVSEGEGKRTVQMTLYNDAAAKLAGSGRTVELGFYTDSAYTKPAEIQLVGQQSGVALNNNKITLSGDALGRLDLGVLTLQVTYDLANYVNNTLNQEEVPGSGVQLYAMAQIRDDEGVMREFATGNNMTSVQLTGALARTGETTTLDVTLDNTSGKTKATVTLKNNSLRSQPSGGTLVAVLLDENGKSLDSKVVTTNSALTCEQTLEVDIEFEKLGADVVVLYDNSTDSSGLQELRFSGIPVGLGDFEQALDEDGQHIADQYVLTLDDDAPASTVVSFISGDPVTVNGTGYDKAGSAEVDIPYGNSTITIVSGGVTYIMNLNRSYPYSGGGSTGYKVKVEPTENGTVTVSPTSPKKGDTVTITATPDEDYKVGTVTVTDEDGKAVAVSGGDGKYTFTQPGSNVTVAVKFIWDSPFSDVGDAWYTEAVHYVYENGLMAGTGATTFDPEMKLTRAMTAQILYNLEGKPQVTEDATFTDMDVAPTWSLDAIAWAQDTGVVAGMGNNLFDPNANVTREQFAQMMYNYASYKKLDLTATGDLTQFPDGDQVSNWAETALSWANGKGLINGHAESGLLDPQGNTTRAQAASIIANFDKNVAK